MLCDLPIMIKEKQNLILEFVYFTNIAKGPIIKDVTHCVGVSDKCNGVKCDERYVTSFMNAP